MNLNRILLDSQVVHPLEGRLGSRLKSVSYRPLVGEMTDRAFRSQNFWMGGEVELSFHASGSLFVSWEENAGWPCHFSLVVAPTSVFEANALEDWPAHELRSWSRLLNERLVSFVVLGTHETPFAVKLSFETGDVFLSTGCRTAFGDGDDLLVRFGEVPSEVGSWDRLGSKAAWSSARPEPARSGCERTR